MGCHSSRHGNTGGGIIDGNTKKAMAELISFNEEDRTLIPELQCFNNTIPKLKESLLNDLNLLLLAKGYLNHAVATQKLVASIKLCLSRAHNKQTIILKALKCYEKEEADNRSFKEKYSLTISKLEEFKEAGDPFSGLSTNKFSLLHEQQMSILNELNSRKHEIKEKLGAMKKWKKILKITQDAVFVAALACSVTLVVTSAPLFAAAAMTAGSTTIKTAEQWFDSIWAKREGILEGEKNIVLLMIKGKNLLRVHELESVRVMLKRLEIKIGSVSGDVGFALMNQEEEIALEMAMEEVKDKVGFVDKWIDEVELKADACDGEINKAVAEFLNVIMHDL